MDSVKTRAVAHVSWTVSVCVLSSLVCTLHIPPVQSFQAGSTPQSGLPCLRRTLLWACFIPSAETQYRVIKFAYPKIIKSAEVVFVVSKSTVFKELFVPPKGKKNS